MKCIIKILKYFFKTKTERCTNNKSSTNRNDHCLIYDKEARLYGDAKLYNKEARRYGNSIMYSNDIVTDNSSLADDANISV